jgi:hypothetical protein
MKFYFSFRNRDRRRKLVDMINYHVQVRGKWYWIYSVAFSRGHIAVVTALEAPPGLPIHKKVYFKTWIRGVHKESRKR